MYATIELVSTIRCIVLRNGVLWVMAVLSLYEMGLEDYSVIVVLNVVCICRCN